MPSFGVVASLGIEVAANEDFQVQFPGLLACLRNLGVELLDMLVSVTGIWKVHAKDA